MKNLPQNEGREIDRLRQLLLGTELSKLDQLSKRLENKEKFSSEIGEVLPQAMLKSASQNDHLSQALVPTVEEIVRLSIKRDINKFADALFPVIGPAVRKSITETIRQMFRSMNQIIENSFSLQGLKWRIESMRTGVPFAQIVLSKSLVFEVDQVFLIHHTTGLLLSHVERDGGSNHNPDMVSSMLTAIDDFVNDSFTPGENQSLGSIEVGSVSIWLAKSPNVILALAITGNAPSSLHATMDETLEKIESLYADALLNFNGDVSAFESMQNILYDCLTSQYQSPTRKFSAKFWLVSLILISILGYWIAMGLYQSKLQGDYLAMLDSEPGYAVTSSRDVDGVFQVKGLRDPLARAPEQVLQESQLKLYSVSHLFRPYQSLEDTLVFKRVQAMLELPKNVTAAIAQGQLELTGYASEDWVASLNRALIRTTGVTSIKLDGLKTQIDLSSLAMTESIEYALDIENGRLQVTGYATAVWRDQARKLAVEIPGINEYDDSMLLETIDLSVFNPPDTVELNMEGTTLMASGQASVEWINSLQKLAQDYALISLVDTSALVNIEMETLKTDIQLLEDIKVFFDAATSFNFEANEVLDAAAIIANRIIVNAKLLSKQPLIIVRGFSDSLGSFEDNKFLSEERADYVSQYLFNTGISPRYVFNEGLKEQVESESTEEQRRFNRRVEFIVELKEQVDN